MNKVLLVIGFAAASLILGMLLWSWQQSRLASSRLPDAQAATVLPQPRSLPAFALADHQGRAFGPEQLRGHWSLLFFGFTRCPDICPNTLGLLQAVSAALRQEDHPAADGLQVVFVSVDPRHDTPAALKSYVEYFDPAFIGVTGPEPELQKLTGGLYMPYTYVPVGQGSDYTVEHSGALVLLNPQAQVVAYFSPPLRAASIVDDLRRLLRG
jgi:protein SCO1/2